MLAAIVAASGTLVKCRSRLPGGTWTTKRRRRKPMILRRREDRFPIRSNHLAFDEPVRMPFVPPLAREVPPGRRDLLVLLQLKVQVPGLGEDQLFHSQPDGFGRARKRKDDLAASDPTHGAAEHGGGADFLKREHPEQLTEAVELL